MRHCVETPAEAKFHVCRNCLPGLRRAHRDALRALHNRDMNTSVAAILRADGFAETMEEALRAERSEIE